MAHLWLQFIVWLTLIVTLGVLAVRVVLKYAPDRHPVGTQVRILVFVLLLTWGVAERIYGAVTALLYRLLLDY